MTIVISMTVYTTSISGINRTGAKSTFYNKDISKYIEESPCKKVIKDLHCKIEAQYKKINQPELWDDINFRIAFVGSAIQYSDDLETNGKQEFFSDSISNHL
jgi:hypothetical protein